MSHPNNPFSKQNQKNAQAPATVAQPSKAFSAPAPVKPVAAAPFVAPSVPFVVVPAPQDPPLHYPLEVEPIAAQAVAVAQNVSYKVLADFKVARGSSYFILRKGKVISAKGYDIEALKLLGVSFEQI